MFEDQLVEVATLGRALPEQSVQLLQTLLADRSNQIQALLAAVRDGTPVTPALGTPE